MVIARNENVEWNSAILDLFLTKSNSTLSELCLRLTIPATEVLNIVEKLQLCSNTLKSLSLVLIRPDSDHGRKLITFITLQCPNLVSLKVLYAHWIPKQLTIEHDRLEVELSSRSNRKSLWVHRLPLALLEKDSKFLQNLTTLSLERVENQGELRKILEVTKSHLRSLHFRTSQEGEGLETLSLEALKRIEVSPPFDKSSNSFPKWLKCPNLELLVLDGIGECSTIESFPQSVDEVWLSPDPWATAEPSIVKSLLESFAAFAHQLTKLKIISGFLFEREHLVKMLKSRKESEQVLELQVLIVGFDGIEELVRGYVGETLDFSSLPEEFALY